MSKLCKERFLFPPLFAFCLLHMLNKRWPFFLQDHLIPGAYKFDALITTFEMILSDCPELREISWRCVIIDEAHRLKNRNCKLLDSLKMLDLVSHFETKLMVKFAQKSLVDYIKKGLCSLKYFLCIWYSLTCLPD